MFHPHLPDHAHDVVLIQLPSRVEPGREAHHTATAAAVSDDPLAVARTALRSVPPLLPSPPHLRPFLLLLRWSSFRRRHLDAAADLIGGGNDQRQRKGKEKDEVTGLVGLQRRRNRNKIQTKTNKTKQSGTHSHNTHPDPDGHATSTPTIGQHRHPSLPLATLTNPHSLRLRTDELAPRSDLSTSRPATD